MSFDGENKRLRSREFSTVVRGLFRSEWAERAIGRRVDLLSSARIAAQIEIEESLVIPDSPFDEIVRVSDRVGGVHGRREGVQSGNIRRDIDEVGERPGRGAEQVSFLGFSPHDD
jgi:hypothetical protein